MLAMASPLGLVAQAQAEEHPALTGRWEASPLVVQWTLGDWGEACGPKPRNERRAGGFVSITERGNELSISGPGEPFSTANCLERHPGMIRAGHSASKRAWSTVCKTNSGDPRVATVQTSIQATDDTIRFEETGRFSFSIRDQKCAASSRKSRTYRLVERRQQTQPLALAARDERTIEVPSERLEAAASEHAPQDGMAGEEPPAARSSTAEQGRCANPGPPNQINVHPVRGLLRPGDELTFAMEIVDARGCKLPNEGVNWAIAPNHSGVTFPSVTHLAVDDGAEIGELTLTASVGPISKNVALRIVSSATYDALLADTIDDGAVPESQRVAAVQGWATNSEAAIAPDTGRTRKYWFAAVVAFTAMSLGGLGGVVLLQSRRRSRTARPAHTPARRSAATPGKICPTCGSMYGSEARFCEKDGVCLVQAN